MLKKLISVIMSITILITYSNISFANDAFNQAQTATNNASKVFDGATPQVKANIDTIPKAAPSLTKDQTTQNPAEPTFMQKLAQDVKDNKWSYITVGAAAGFLGFLLGGPLGILIGIGAMSAFTVAQRANYIDAFVKPK